MNEEELKRALYAKGRADVLDKVRDEIDLETRIQVKHYTNTDDIIDAVLDVIDRYKAESR